VKDLIAYRFQKDILVKEVAAAKIPSEFGDFKIHVFENLVDGKEHIALVKGEWKEDEDILVRVHSECLTGDVFGSFRCDCGPQLEQALKNIEEHGKGVLLYMRQEGRGIGLINKIKAYALQEEGMDTVEANEHLGFKADARDYGIGAQILHSLGIRKMILMTNNPKKRVGINSYGLEVVDTKSIEIIANEHNKSYLKTKKEKLGHLLKNM
jgi:3,4-dihydroxy 2-butanone 4-phosphate synthase/GTP cyclohydrolase II